MAGMSRWSFFGVGLPATHGRLPRLLAAYGCSEDEYSSAQKRPYTYPALEYGSNWPAEPRTRNRPPC